MVLENWIAPILESYLKDYVEGIDARQLSAGVFGGDIGLRNLRLKKGALDKFRLPVDVVEGFIGKISVKISWNLLKERPVQVEMDDIYLLAVPAAQSKYDPEEDMERQHAVKMEKLRTAELLVATPDVGKSAEQQKKEEAQMQGMASRIIDNLQITVKRVHLRYEDSIGDHPFAGGITLGGFSAQSTDENWEPSYIVNATQGVHKLANLESLAVYFDTDSPSLAGLPPDEAVKRFTDLIASQDNQVEHQFVLKPVSGQGRLLLHKRWDLSKPKTSADLIFKEIGLALDDDQYRAVNQMYDLLQQYARQREYMPFRPPPEDFTQNKARARLIYACRSIRNDIRQKHRPYTWQALFERRDDRKAYIDLYKKRSLAASQAQQPQPEIDNKIDELEHKLSYRDIRFFRSLAKAELRRDEGHSKALAEKQQNDAPKENQAAAGGGWLGWIWGGAGQAADGNSVATTAEPHPEMDESSRKQLNDFFDWDQTDIQAISDAIDMPPEAVRLRVHAKLDKGSFVLKRDPHGENRDMIALVFDAFSADYLQRPENLEAAVALGGMRVQDYTCPGSLHTEVLRVKADGTGNKRQLQLSHSLAFDMPEVDEQFQNEARSASDNPSLDKPFFFVKFERKPLDKRADVGVTMRLRYTEIFYRAAFVEEVFRFFSPPKSELESRTALISAASETIEGLRRATRAQVEFALEQHKTFDLRVDMNAPVVIIPEDITREDCLHMVIDAGHIGVISKLPTQAELKELRNRQGRAETEEEVRMRERLAYSKFVIQLQSTQVVMGDRLAVCMEALSAEQAGPNHLLAKINMDWIAESRIAPPVADVEQFRLSGHLPDLSISMSDRKYRSLMRMVDVAVPNFDSNDPGEDVTGRPRANSRASASRGRPRSKSISFAGTRYEEDEDEDLIDEADDERDDFFEAPEFKDRRSEQVHQKTFQLDFSVDRLSAAISRSHPDPNKPDRLLAVAVLEGFRLGVGKRTYDMAVDVILRTLYIEDKMVDEQSGDFRQLVTSKQLTTQGKSNEDTDLVRVRYESCQSESPEFQSVHEGFHKTVDVEMSTLNLIVTRASILMLLDFLLTTFTDGPDTAKADSETLLEEMPTTAVSRMEPPEPAPIEKMRIKVKLNSIVFILNDDDVRLATLELAAGDVAIMLRGPALRVSARLGNLSVTDDLASHCDGSSDFRQLLSIKDQEVADFLYETFDPAEPSYPGYDSLIHLKTGSLQFTFLEDPIHRIIRFLTQFGKMKAVYDATRADSPPPPPATTEPSRMHYDITIRSPIIIFPRDHQSTDILVANLGEFRAKNRLDGDVVHTDAGLRAVRLASLLNHGQERHELEMLADLNLDVKMTENRAIDRSQDLNTPDTMLHATLSDIKMNLTERQYGFCMALSSIIPRAFSSRPEEEQEDRAKIPAAMALPASTSEKKKQNADKVIVDLYPELPRLGHTADGGVVPLYPKMQLRLSVQTISLDLFTGSATDSKSLRQHGLARFALNGTKLFYRTVSNDSMEMELCSNNLRLTDTDVKKNTKWREIVPASKHSQHDQIMLSYSQSGGSDRTALANLTIDTPTVLFSLEPIYALSDFFGSASSQSSQPTKQDVSSQPQPSSSSLDYRVNIANAKIMLLSDPERSDTEAIVLSVDQLQMAQQGILALSVTKLGMSLCKMDNQKEMIRLLDDFDTTLSIDSRAQGDRITSSIDLEVQPIVLRVSYRDVLLVQRVVQKAIDLSNKPDLQGSDSSLSMDRTQNAPAPEADSVAPVTAAPSQTGTKDVQAGTLQLMMSRQRMKATFDGLQVILVGDLQELPLLKLSAPKFMATATDWSSDLVAKTILSPSVDFFNLSNSQWEPLVDPWEIHLSMSKQAEKGKSSYKFESKKRLEVNLSSTFIDIANTTMSQLSHEADSVINMDRGARAPFLIKNRTGHHIQIQAGTSSRSSALKEPTRIDNGRDLPWRFDDWRTMRESDKSSNNNLRVMLLDSEFNPVERVAVDKETESIYDLKPRVKQIKHRMVCEVVLKDNVKIVTLRSTFNVENLTAVPLEMVLLDENKKQAMPVIKLAPGSAAPLPIESAFAHSVLVRPDTGFGYEWPRKLQQEGLEDLHWQDLIKKPSRRLICQPKRGNGYPFIIQVYGKHDKNDPMLRSYPRLTLKLRSPLEVENLLPFDIQFKLYDKLRDPHPSQEFLRAGGAVPIHRADLWHLLLLNVQVSLYLVGLSGRPSEFAIINTHNHVDLSVEDTLAIEDIQRTKLELRLNYVRIPDAGGAFKVQVYSPYVFINKTQLPFWLRPSSRDFSAYRGMSSCCAQDPEGHRYFEPILLSMPNSDRKAVLAQLKLAESEWSKALPINTPGPAAEVILAKPSSGRQLRIGMRITEGIGALSRVVAIYPRYIFRNDTSSELRLQQQGDTGNVWVLQAGQSQPRTDFLAVEGAPQIVASLGTSAFWSSPFRLQDVGKVFLRYQLAHDDNETRGLLEVDVLVEGATVHVHLSEAKHWPYVIRNDMSDLDLAFSQKMPDGQRASRTYRLPGNTSVEYAFDDPSLQGKSIAVWAQSRPQYPKEVGIMEIGPQKPFVIPGPERSDIVAIDTFAQEHTQTVTFSAYDINSNAYKKVGEANNVASSQLQRASTSVSTNTQSLDFEIAEPEAPVTFEVDLSLEGIGISLINKKLVELAYCSFRGFHINYRDTDFTTAISFSCKWIQFDNQLNAPSFEVFLYPQVIPKDGKDLDARPNVEAEVKLLKDQSHGVVYCKYASILMQEMTIEVDEEFIYTLIDFIGSSTAGQQATIESKLLEEERGIPEAQQVEPGTELYFEVLHLQPIALNLSFMRTDSQDHDARTFLDARNPLSFALNALTMTLGNVNDAAIKLSALYIENLRASSGVLTERAWLHYSQQFMSQTYRVIFSADFLGNPIGLFNNVSSGVADIFYQPINGFVVHGNTDIGYSIAKGTGSFVKKTVFGFSDSFAKFTGSVGKGLAAATLDKDFQNKRRMRISRNKPKHALGGIQGGASSLGLSFVSGVEGITRLPSEGAGRDGAAGFFKGVGKAAVGLVAKPATGFFDMANNVTEGIRNTTTVFDPTGLERVRLPRVIPYDGVLRTYAEHAALGQSWLREVNNGRFDNDVYFAHQQMLPPGNASQHEDYVAMLTTQRIMCLRVTRPKIIWEVPMTELSEIRPVNQCIVLDLQKGVRGPDIQLSSESAKKQLYDRLFHLVNLYNHSKTHR